MSQPGTGKRVAVTGGAGYIGSHTVLELLDSGYEVIVIDDLSYGYLHNVPPGLLREITLSDTAAVEAALIEKHVDAVIHFAAFISVGESMQRPEIYFQNNTCGSVSLFTAMLRAGVKKLVFSSTAAVYGMPRFVPIPETLPYAPVNVYGESKMMVEKILDWFDPIHDLKSVCLRYFNASGADPKGRRGEEHRPETHLIPLMFRAIKTGRPVTIFGSDYPTPDGTCIRDYVHVTDLAQAHISAVEHLLAGGESQKFNAGTGTGFSVKQMIDSVEKVTGQKVPFQLGPRREGDPAELVSDSTKLQRVLGWKPRFAQLDEIVRTAWEFEEATSNSERARERPEQTSF